MNATQYGGSQHEMKVMAVELYVMNVCASMQARWYVLAGTLMKSAMTHEELSALPWLDAICRETFRL